MPPPYTLSYDQPYLDDLEDIDAFDIPMILYDVRDGVVTILRLRWKGSLTTEEMGP